MQQEMNEELNASGTQPTEPTEPNTEPTNEPNTEPNPEQNVNENPYIGAPEKYDYTTIKMPEGYQYDSSLAEKFSPIAKELNLSQQGVNKLCDFFVQYQQGLSANSEQKIAEFKNIEKAKTKASYEQMLNTDAEIGGGDEEKMNAYIDKANIGYKEFANQKLQDVLAEHALNFHPEVIKLFYRLGKLCGQDNIITTNNPVKPSADPATVLYGEDKKE